MKLLELPGDNLNNLVNITDQFKLDIFNTYSKCVIGILPLTLTGRHYLSTKTNWLICTQFSERYVIIVLYWMTLIECFEQSTSGIEAQQSLVKDLYVKMRTKLVFFN